MRSFIVLSFVSFFALSSSAQTTSPATPSVPVRGVLGGSIASVSGSFTSSSPWIAFEGGAGFPGGIITGSPYSAEQVTEHVQTLADGTHITERAQTTKLYRDSYGRTRTERGAPLPPGPLGQGVVAPVFTDIFDPVAGVRYTLEPQSHTAHRMSMPVAPPPPPPPANGTAVPGARIVKVLPAQLPAQSASTPQDQSSRPQFSHESLGTQTIEGVLAEGMRTTVTYPAGSLGNDKPITTTSETWTSPELKMVVLSKNSDPRSGDSTTRLTNISRAEPDASLFQVPPDYQIAQ